MFLPFPPYHRFFFSSSSLSRSSFFHLSPLPSSLLVLPRFSWISDEKGGGWSRSRGENIDAAKWTLVSRWGWLFSGRKGIENLEENWLFEKMKRETRDMRRLRKKSVFANDTIKYSSTVTEGGEEGVIVTRITAGWRISVRSKGDKFPRQISLVQLSFINEDIGIPLRGVPYV